MGTREDIFDASLEVFARKGYSAATMGDIAARVGIKKPSLYNHFPSKESLLEEIYLRLREIALPKPGEPAPAMPQWTSAAEAFEHVVRGYIAAWSEARAERSWTIVSEQQYVDPRAARIIFDMTENYLDKTELLFETLRSRSLLRFEGEARGRAETFAYAVRSMHLEYGLTMRHGLPADRITSRMYALAARFAADE
jgi:AcrR family transcriptional regulator